MKKIAIKFTAKSTAISAVAALSFAAPVFAESSGHGKMANEWTVSTVQNTTKPGEADQPEATVAGSGSGAGKANFQDLSFTNGSSSEGAGAKAAASKSKIYLKLGAIKGESQDR